MREKEARMINTTALAYVGDSVYETAIRKHILETGQTNVDKLHQITVGFVRAENQAIAIKAIIDSLSEDEQALVRRARNRKITSCPRNLDPVIYKLATAFEAFVGYLYLSEETDRLDWFIEKAIRVINENGAKDVKR